MHIVQEERTMARPSAFKRTNYSHCPLKKRPVHVFIKDEPELRIKEETSDDNSEPENLSTKPEDLSKNLSTALAALGKKDEEIGFIPQGGMHFLSKPGPLEPLSLNAGAGFHPYAPALVHPAFHYPELYRPMPTYPKFVPAAYPVRPEPAFPTYGQPEDLSSPGSGPSSPPSRPRDAPRYQCSFCGKSYSTYSGLSKHQQFHCSANEDSSAKKTFSCKHCDKVYVSLGALKMHIRTHTLPCKCKLCGKAFSRPWLLQGHIRTHTGEKPFTCPHCNRAFADRSNLRAHLQTHSDVKKYSCPTCSKTFSRMSLLTKHCDGGCPGLSPPHQSPSPVLHYQQEIMSA